MPWKRLATPSTLLSSSLQIQTNAILIHSLLCSHFSHTGSIPLYFPLFLSLVLSHLTSLSLYFFISHSLSFSLSVCKRKRVSFCVHQKTNKLNPPPSTFTRYWVMFDVHFIWEKRLSVLFVHVLWPVPYCLQCIVKRSWNYYNKNVFLYQWFKKLRL